ncbi:phospholipid scramblase 2-like [Helicoverpa zea]|uniref:phospholipid scramblase 2-like n=1 Tax=Helicoverpa zea TaxID=7113 RepID=UPI001F56A2B1|nr:phospholipid scramblase 2-like [Helicoverpa zea]
MPITNIQKNEVEDITPWMTCPNVPDETIPGLAFVYPLDQLIIAEKRDVLHDLIGTSGIAYTIFNRGGQKVFLAVLTKRFQAFNVKIFNNYGNEVINVEKPFKIFANKVLVWAPPGNFVGSVQKCLSCIDTYSVKNQVGKKVLKIRAEGMFHYAYKVFLVYGNRSIGVVQDKLPTTMVFDVKNFGVTFPPELDVKDKTVLLGASFLIACSKY